MIELPSSPSSPAKLYALQLKLRPIERGTLMPFTGEMVHAAWLATLLSRSRFDPLWG